MRMQKARRFSLKRVAYTGSVRRSGDHILFFGCFHSIVLSLVPLFNRCQRIFLPNIFGQATIIVYSFDQYSCLIKKKRLFPVIEKA